MTAKIPPPESGANPEREKNRVETKVFSRTERAGGHSENEDSILALREMGLFGVFDGVGGEKAGNVASSTVRDYLISQANRLANLSSPEDAARELEKILTEANRKIMDMAAANPGDYGDMATTVSVGKLMKTPEGELKLIVAHAGDSRVYRGDTENNLTAITEDDDYIQGDYRDNQAQADKIRLKIDISSKLGLSLDEYSYYKNRNVIRNSMGHPQFAPRITIVSLRPGDKILFTSDGIHDNLRQSEIEKVMREKSSVPNLAGEMLSAARAVADSRNERAKDDDMSAVLVEVTEPWKNPERQQAAEQFARDQRELKRMLDAIAFDFRTLSIEEFKEFFPKCRELAHKMTARYSGQEFDKELAAIKDSLEVYEDTAKKLGANGSTPEQRKITGELMVHHFDVLERLDWVTAQILRGENQKNLTTQIKNIKYLTDLEYVRKNFQGAAGLEETISKFEKYNRRLEAEFKLKYEGGPKPSDPREKEQKELEFRKQIEQDVDRHLESEMDNAGMTPEEKEQMRTKNPFFRRKRQEMISELFEEFKSHL